MQSQPYRLLLLFIIIFPFIFSSSLLSHGFAESTLIKTWNDHKRIQSIAHEVSKNKKIVSYHFKKQRLTTGYVQSAGKSESNCYVRICLEQHPKTGSFCKNNISCTPAQEFYLPAKNCWVAACELQTGDQLFCASGEQITITHLEFIKQPLTVYILALENHHNFFVGKHEVITHNTTLPWECSMLFSIPFGTSGGAGIGGKAGSFFGPVGIVGGIIIGGVIGWAASSYIQHNKVHTYEALFDIDVIDAYFKTESTSKHSSVNRSSANIFPEPPEDPDKEKKKDDDPYVHPSTPVGRKNSAPTPTVQKGLRKPTIIHGRTYSGHALERLQERGLTPSIVEHVIKQGVASPNKVNGRISHYDPINNITIITEADNSVVVTASYGKIL